MINTKNKSLDNLRNKIENINKEKEALLFNLETLREEYIELENEVLLQSYGFFVPKYDLEDSEAYKTRLKTINGKQKEMVRTKDAVNYFKDWTVDESKAKGKKMTTSMIRQPLGTFNSECDIAISKIVDISILVI